MSAAVAAAGEPRGVLLLHSFRNALPINAAFLDGIVEGLDFGADARVEVDSETLDLSRVGDEAYVRKLIEIFKLKYGANPPSVVIPTYTPALRLLLKHRNELFPGVPIVFCAVELSAAELKQLPADVTGVTSRRDFAGTLELMSRLHPDLQRVMVVVGAGPLDKAWERDALQALSPYESRFELVWLRGVPLRDIAAAVGSLPPHTAILYLVQFADRDGTPYVPQKVAQAVAEAANAPVYGLWDTLFEAGIVGGRVIAVQQQGKVAGEIARRVLMGDAPAAIPIVDTENNDPIVDWRQLRRWNLDERRLPAESQILNREPSLWERHRQAIFLAAGVIALQAIWIIALMLNRRRLRRTQHSFEQEVEHRMQAEGDSRRLRTRLSAAEKQTNLGTLAGGIAHEINQPLIAIKNYAQAAKRYLAADPPQGGKLAELLAEMEGEVDRAGAIIRKVRKLLASGRVDAEPVELDPVLREVVAVMKHECEVHACRIDYPLPQPVPKVLADALQVQLVLVNLLRNAIEATEAAGPLGERTISVGVTTRADEGKVQVSVVDRGPGISADDAEEIFEPLFTTKASGMGIGLATCRTIIEAHGGRIGCEPNPAGGTVFRFTLPIA